MPYSFSTCKHFLGHEHNQIMYNKHIKSSGFPSIELIMHCISLIYNLKNNLPVQIQQSSKIHKCIVDLNTLASGYKICDPHVKLSTYTVKVFILTFCVNTDATCSCQMTQYQNNTNGCSKMLDTLYHLLHVIMRSILNCLQIYIDLNCAQISR